VAAQNPAVGRIAGWTASAVTAAVAIVGLAFAVASAFGLTALDFTKLIGLELSEAQRVLLGTFVFAVAMFFDRTRLLRQLNAGTNRNRLLEQIAAKRREGVTLRNRGQLDLRDDVAYKSWVVEFDEWHAATAQTVAKLAKHEGEAFMTLDTYTPADDLDGNYSSPHHRRSVSIFTGLLRVLEDIRRRYSAP